MSRVSYKAPGDRLAADEVNRIVDQAWRAESPPIGSLSLPFDFVERVVVEAASHDSVAMFGEVTYSLRRADDGGLEANVDFSRRWVPAVYAEGHYVKPAAVGTPGLLFRFPANAENGEQRYRAWFWLFDEQPARAPCASEG